MNILARTCAVILGMACLAQAQFDDSSLEMSDSDFIEAPPRKSAAVERPVIAVPLFRNATTRRNGEELPDNSREIAADAAAEALVATRRYRLLSRSNPVVQQLDEESTFQGTQISSAAQNVFEALAELNAKYVLIGRINTFRLDHITGKAYGVERRIIKPTISLDLQLISVKSNEIVASKNISQRGSINVPQGVTTMSELADWETLLRAAVRKSIPEFINSIQDGISVEDGSYVVDSPSRSSSRMAKTVSIEVKSTPEGADVEIDGIMQGSTPCVIEIPSLKSEITVSMEGYKPWKKTIMPREGLKLNPTLGKEAAPVPAPAN